MLAEVVVKSFLLSRAENIFTYKIPKNSIDLLFIGSSHSYCTFNSRLFDHYLKCNSLNLGTDSQSFKITYFSMSFSNACKKSVVTINYTINMNGNKIM